MNLRINPTKEALARLLASQDDNEGHHILWVDQLDYVRIDLLSNDYEFEMEAIDRQCKFRIETYCKGNDYVGPEASQDDRYVTDLHARILKAWRDGERGLIIDT